MHLGSRHGKQGFLIITISILLLAVFVPLPNVNATSPSIAISKTTGGPGTIVTVTGANFGNSLPLSISISGHDENLVPNAFTNIDGTFSQTISIPSDTIIGADTITASDSSSHSATASFKVPAPSITISKTSGGPGTILTVTGVNFGSSSQLLITVSGHTGNLASNAVTNIDGTFSQAVSIPSDASAGSDLLAVYDSSSHSATASFKVPASSITISKTSGGPGTIVTIAGVNFGSNSQLVITVSGHGGNLAFGTMTNIDGTFSQIVSIPSDATIGSDIINASDTSHSASASFKVPASSITISKTAGGPGTIVTITGANFGSNSQLSITIPGHTGNLAFGTMTNIDGTFSQTISIPSDAAIGADTIAISDTSFHSASASFRVPAPSITLSKTSGGSGTIVTVTGTNFGSNSQLLITISGHTGNLAFGTITNIDGTFSQTISIPSDATVGTDTITASDASSHSATALFKNPK